MGDWRHAAIWLALLSASTGGTRATSPVSSQHVQPHLLRLSDQAGNSMTATLSSRIRVMCVDDHPIIRQGLSAVLANDPKMELVAEATTGEDALGAFRKHRPNVTLMDLHLPGMTGVEAVVAICREFRDARIVVMATETDDVQIQCALAAGARGYIYKGMPMIDVLAIIHQAHTGAPLPHRC
jgi:CheY-like chemotaxis protein